MKNAVLCFLLVMISYAQASVCTISWDPDKGKGINYRVCRVVDGKLIPVGETKGTQLSADFKAGDQVVVVAFSAFAELGEAIPSVPITIPADREGVVHLHVYSNSKLDGKRVRIATYYIPMKESDFFDASWELVVDPKPKN